MGKQKQKILYIAQYLMEHTDEKNGVTTPELIEYLRRNGIDAERKSIYGDIEELTDFGMDIVRIPGKNGGYMLASRDFELAEVKLLVDLVQSAKFITTQKSRSLIGKLEKLVSKQDAKRLQRQVVVADRNKTQNENIYYNVDAIHEAIADNAKIRFQYFDWDVKKEQKLRKNGAFYEISPWLLTWDDENYYLVGYDEEVEYMKHYRVDKMIGIEKTKSPRQGREQFEKMDVAAFSKKTFGMFAGEEKTIQLAVDKAMTGVMIDRFGRDVPMRELDENRMVARVSVAVSAQFYGWLAGLGGKVTIFAPEEEKIACRKYLESLLDNCE